MSEPDLSSITPVAQDYLKVIWSATEWGDPPITTGALAIAADINRESGRLSRNPILFSQFLPAPARSNSGP